MLVEVLRVPLLRLGDNESLRDLGMLSPSLSRSSRKWRVFSTYEDQNSANTKLITILTSTIPQGDRNLQSQGHREEVSG